MNVSMLRPSRIVFAALVVALAACTASAQVTTHYYRYALSVRTQEPAFANEIPSAAHVSGNIFETETDAQGRMTQAARLRNGQKLYEADFRFPANAKLPDGYDDIREGEKTGFSKIQRDASGRRIREDHFVVSGTLSGYETYSYSNDDVEIDYYTADGKKASYKTRSYSTTDTLIRSISFSNPDNPGNHSDFEFDGSTGYPKSHQEFINGKLNVRVSYTYNADGDRVREDTYDTNNNWYSADEFSDDLLTKRIYKNGDATREFDYTYDAKRWRKETTLHVKGVLICKFVYDRLSDGRVKRTLALGPNGELFAEYPDMEILDIQQNGHPISGKTATFYKTDNWY